MTFSFFLKSRMSWKLYKSEELSELTFVRVAMYDLLVKFGPDLNKSMSWRPFFCSYRFTSSTFTSTSWLAFVKYNIGVFNNWSSNCIWGIILFEIEIKMCFLCLFFGWSDCLLFTVPIESFHVELSID